MASASILLLLLHPPHLTASCLCGGWWDPAHAAPLPPLHPWQGLPPPPPQSLPPPLLRPGPSPDLPSGVSW
jgi:hypothetical protein